MMNVRDAIPLVRVQFAAALPQLLRKGFAFPGAVLEMRLCLKREAQPPRLKCSVPESRLSARTAAKSRHVTVMRAASIRVGVVTHGKQKMIEVSFVSAFCADGEFSHVRT